MANWKQIEIVFDSWYNVQLSRCTVGKYSHETDARAEIILSDGIPDDSHGNRVLRLPLEELEKLTSAVRLHSDRSIVASDFVNVIRILTPRDKKTLVQKALKLSEEAGEVASAANILDKAPGLEYKSKGEVQDRLNLIEECLDTIIVATSIMAEVDATDAEIDSLTKDKLNKWREVLAPKQANDLDE